ncbi:DUF3592 domain-containing protein [Chitinophaga deserti]|uniref:DUF3592 domain-containing protein n=1 Tax=Chitinophaga deserti TaxID=2164099 RepID=UPI000D6D9B61|nr:DUF3592 domain-containing protein [Chitinophaga deserti]
MPIILILLLVFSFIPLAITLFRWRNHFLIRRRGIQTNGVVLSKHVLTMKRGRAVDNLHIEFRDTYTGQIHRSHAYAAFGKFKPGDQVTLHYLPNTPAKIVLTGGLSYVPMFIFSILLILFVIFAVYKLEEMIRTGDY